MNYYRKIVSKFIIVLLVFVGSFLSCEKNDKSENPYYDSIIGEWKWIKTYIDLPISDMNPLTPENTGITESVIFTKDRSWSKIKNQIEVESGEKFTIGHGIYITGGPNWLDSTKWVEFKYEYDSILYIKNGIPAGTDYFKIEENNLVFSSDFTGTTIGIGSKWYERN